MGLALGLGARSYTVTCFAPVRRAVLSLRYISLLRWPEIQQRLEEQGLFYSQRQIFNLHRMGLKDVERSLHRKTKK